ncbi:hypothetical protein BJ165DRAFT_1428921, partial [Panaeolus papilionaceus]
MSFNAALLLPHPSLHHPHRQRRIQRQPSKLALFRLDRCRRVDVIQEDPPSLEPLQFPKEPIIDLTTCFGHWAKQENSTLARNDAENDDHNTPNLNQLVFLNLPQSLTSSTTQKPDQLPNNNQKSSCAFTIPIDHLSPPSSSAMSTEYPKRSQSDCGHEYTHQPRVQQKLQKSSSLLRGFSLSARSRHDIYSHYTQQPERDVPTTQSHLSPSPAPPSSWSRVGSAVSLNPSSSAEPSPTPSRNTSSSSLSRWMFWRGSAPSWKGKAREEYDDDYAEDQTTWETTAVNRSEEAKRLKVARLSPPPPTPPATYDSSPSGQVSPTNHDTSKTCLDQNPTLSRRPSTSNLKLPNEIDLSQDSTGRKNTSRHKTNPSISSVRTLVRAMGHERNASWGDAAAVLLFGTAAEAIADRERERADLLDLLGEQVFGGSAAGMETRDEDGVDKTSLKSTPSQRRRAKFVLGGGESELDVSEGKEKVSRSRKPAIARPRLARRDAYVDADSDPEDVDTPVSVPDDDTTGSDAMLMQRYRSVAEAIVDESLLDEELMRVVESLRKERLARPGPLARSRSTTTSASSTSASNGSTPVSTSGSSVSSPAEEWEAIDDLRREIWEGVPIVGSPEYDVGLHASIRWGLTLQDGEYTPLRDNPQEFANEVDTTFNFTGDAKSTVRPKVSQPVSPSSVSRSLSLSSTSSSPTSPNPSPTYQTALRALLITREILLTETNYLTSLTQLLTSKTRTPPPALMLHYASDLLQVSKKLAEEMRGDVSVKGIARAFLKCEMEVERAFVRWCGVVGGWFVEGREFEEPALIAEGSGSSTVGHGYSGVRGKRNARVSVRQASLVEGEVLENVVPIAEPVSAGAVEDVAQSSNVSPLKRTVSTWRRSLPSMVGLHQEGSHGMSSSAWRKSERERLEAEEEEEREREKERKRRPAVRDLAILPTQRVMRYVLLYRDLLSCTPRNSASRAYVERALDAACRIAGRCDRAQGNAAFVASSSSSSASTSRMEAPVVQLPLSPV